MSIQPPAVPTTTASIAGPSVADLAILVDVSDPGRWQAARRLAARWDPRVESVAVALDGADGPRDDPYRLAERLPDIEAATVVLVAPRRRGPRRLAPGAVVAGRPVAMLQVDRADQVPGTSLPPDPTAPWVVAAMAKNVFLDATEHWADTLVAGGRQAVDVRADRARRDDLVAAVEAGPAVVLYAGHGRARGWAGYQALRFRHLDGQAGGQGVDWDGDRADDPARQPRDPDRLHRACGLVMAFACGTLGRTRNRWPFGVRLVEAGIARTYLAPAMAVRTADAQALADIVVDLLATTRPATVADLVRAIEATLPGPGSPGTTARPASVPAGGRGSGSSNPRPAPDPRRAWRTFRLIGDPLTPLP